MFQALMNRYSVTLNSMESQSSIAQPTHPHMHTLVITSLDGMTVPDVGT